MQGSYPNLRTRTPRFFGCPERGQFVLAGVVGRSAHLMTVLSIVFSVSATRGLEGRKRLDSGRVRSGQRGGGHLVRRAGLGATPESTTGDRAPSVRRRHGAPSRRVEHPITRRSRGGVRSDRLPGSDRRLLHGGSLRRQVAPDRSDDVVDHIDGYRRRARHVGRREDRRGLGCARGLRHRRAAYGTAAFYAAVGIPSFVIVVRALARADTRSS